MTDSLDDSIQIYLSAIEVDLQNALQDENGTGINQLYKMLRYHMGWKEKMGDIKVRGKRIRPLLVLLSCSAAGGNWRDALPAAAGVELVHNFSLIHDDIEDHSPLRRGRPTVWKKWGIAQALNAGDAMFTLAHLQLIRLQETISPSMALRCAEILQQACLHLTQGQHLDLAFEKRNYVSTADYWAMVEGKTAALISASTELGAICASADDRKIALYKTFGMLFGRAFQVLDDFLGIWGNAEYTGKSTQSDLATGKKTMPVLFGLSRGADFSERWTQKPFQAKDIEAMVHLLELEGAKEYTISAANELIHQAIAVLEEAEPRGNSGLILTDLTRNLINRQS